jgi:hypothetical protein
MRAGLSRVSRVAAAILALVWAAAGAGGLVAAYVYGRWVIGAVALFALWYAVLWAWVAARGRLLSWNEAAMPWRAR